MGWFNKSKGIKITPTELFNILDVKYSLINESNVDFEMKFKINRDTHRIGIRYKCDKPLSDGINYSCIYIYVDNQEFRDMLELSKCATIEGKELYRYGKEIIIDDVDKKLLHMHG